MDTTFVLLVGLLSLSMSQGQSFDTIIRNARIIDGTSAPWFSGDVGIFDNKIVAIGSISDSAVAKDELIDANESYLSPGFIDSHTHDDIAIIENASHEFKVVQGVTTVITGNCGFSNYPEGHLADVQTHLRSLLGDVPQEHFYKDFSSFNTSLGSKGIGLNIAPLVGHGPIRLAVIGYDNREATPQEIEAMVTLLDTQLAQGALGLSFGLVYPPSSFASLAELTSLANVVKRYNRVVAGHVRSYEGGLLTSVQEFIKVLRSTRARGLLSHLQAAGVPYWNTSIPQALQMLEEAREDGIDVAVDMYPYLAGSSTILQLLPPSVQSGGIDELLNNLENATFVAYLKNMTETGREPGWESKVALIGYNNIVVGSVVNPNLSNFEGLTIVEGAFQMSVEEFDFLLHVIKLDSGMTNVIMHQQLQDDNYLVYQSRLHMIGSDSIPRAGGGKPHPRGFGSFPRVIGRYAKQEKVISLEEAVRKSTSLTASRFGIRDRGLLALGMKADLVLFSDQIMDEATYQEPTLGPTGIQGVWVNGVRVVNSEGKLISQDILPGKVLFGN